VRQDGKNQCNGDSLAIASLSKAGEESQVQRRSVTMTVRIEDTCTACGLCCDTCPEVFEMGDDMARVIVDEVPPEYEDAVQQAADECPVEAIIIE
jgi:ferredoxin